MNTSPTCSGKGWIMCGMANRSCLFVALCVALILLGLAGHMLANSVWSSPCFLTAKTTGLQCHACHLLDSLALPAPIVMLTPVIATFVLSSPSLPCRGWLPAPLVRPLLDTS